MSVTLIKAKRIWQQEGLTGLAKGGFSQATNLMSAMLFARAKPTFNSIDDLLEASSTAAGGIIAAYQVRSEIRQLLTFLQARSLRTMLEIGTANGGTLFLFTRVLTPNARLFTVDLPGGEFGDGYPVWRKPLYRSFALANQHIDLIRADSHLASTLDMVRAKLRGEPLDFLFIDGDHSYDGVKRDFEMYAPLVRSGGVVALHDIAFAGVGAPSEVDRYWAELTKTYRTHEFIERPDQGWAGIGVVEMP